VEIGPERSLIVGGTTIVPSTYAVGSDRPAAGTVDGSKMDSGPGSSSHRTGSNHRVGSEGELNGKSSDGAQSFESDFTSPESWPEPPPPNFSEAHKSSASKPGILGAYSTVLWIMLFVVSSVLLWP